MSDPAVGYALTWLLPGTVLIILMFVQRRSIYLTRLEALAWAIPILALGPFLLIAIIVLRNKP